jgi:Uma2 family endonuclease
MSTIDRETKTALPPLVDGERLDRATFHERYEAMPPETRAELIGGVVVMGSPVGARHWDVSTHLIGWVYHYRLGKPCLQSGDNATVMLDDLAEPQPDIHLRILPECGGQTRIEGNYLAGAPELVVEVADSSKRDDLADKREDYRRAGVLEYVVVTRRPDGVHWFVRRADQFEAMPPGPDGIFRSEVFPGLWLDPAALFAGDADRLVAALDRGKATPEHAAFAAELAARRRA